MGVFLVLLNFLLNLALLLKIFTDNNDDILIIEYNKQKSNCR
jgi:hypothetical protein